MPWGSFLTGTFFFKERGHFSRKSESALDVQLEDIRRRKKVPKVVIEENGRKTEGICRVYTFTEPREMLLETKDQDGNACYAWRKIDNGITFVFIYEEDLPEGDKKVISFRDKLNRLRGAK